MTSDSDDQPKRPVMLANDSTPTNPAALAGVTLEKKPRIIGEAFSRVSMPTVTLVNSTVRSSQNCGVRIALFALTLPPVESDRALTFGGKPAGFPPKVSCLLYTS